MTTRTIIGTLHHLPDTPWAGATVVFRLVAAFASSSTFPTELIETTTDASGQFSQALAVPDDPEAAARYRCDLPNGTEITFNLAAGIGDVTLESLLVLSLTSAEPNSILVLIGAHIATVAAEDVLGHVRAHADQIDEDGYLTIGGAVSSVNTQTGDVVLDAGDVDADPTGTAAGLVATEASARAAADTTNATAVTTEATARASADTTLQTNITSEATTRATADSDHAALTTAAHGGIVASGDSRLADARTPTGTAGGVLSGSYPSPGFAADMATQAELDAHAGAADPHPGYLTPAEGNAAYQPLDSDLTAIAALVTTSYGRALLALADAAAGRTALGAAPATPLTQALTDGASIAWNTALGAFATLTIGGNRTLANPTNLVAGASYALKITQDGTGSRTLAYGSAFKWVGGTAPVLSTAIGAIDVLTCISDGTNLYGVLQKAWA